MARADQQVLQVAQHLEEQPMLEFVLAEEHQELEPFWKYEASATSAMGRKVNQFSSLKEPAWK